MKVFIDHHDSAGHRKIVCRVKSEDKKAYGRETTINGDDKAFVDIETLHQIGQMFHHIKEDYLNDLQNNK